MLTFKQYLEEAVNAHMTHVADLPFIEGVDGTRKAVNFLRDVRNMLKGGKPSGKLSIKIDGAPAIVCGQDPRDGRFFVAKKGIFNKNPKVYYSQAEIDAEFSGDLHEKFSIALRELSKLGINGIVQGDLLFTKKDLKIEEIDGERCVVYHPNTIVYAVPVDSALGKRILKSEIGIAFHTEYTGSDFSSLQASFGKPIVPSLRKPNTVFAIDAMYEDATGKATFTSDEGAEVDKQLTQIGRAFRTISAPVLNRFRDDATLQQLTLTYINSNVRRGVTSLHGKQMVIELIQAIESKRDAEVAKLKTDEAKKRKYESFSSMLSFLYDRKTATALEDIFNLVRMIENVKLVIVNKLNQASAMKHLLKTRDGFRVTSPEGFVAINTNDQAVKFVDRLEFSRANFSPDFIKGWER